MKQLGKRARGLEEQTLNHEAAGDIKITLELKKEREEM